MNAIKREKNNLERQKEEANSGLSKNQLLELNEAVAYFSHHLHTSKKEIGFEEKRKKFIRIGKDEICIDHIIPYHNQELMNDFRLKTHSNNEELLKDFYHFTTKIESLVFPYFTQTAEQNVKECLLQNSYKSTEAHYASSKLRYYLNNFEQTKVDRLINDLNIPFQGIERRLSEHSECRKEAALSSGTTSISETDTLILSQETIRIEGMVQTLFAKALPLLKEEPGIIWVHSGSDHVHNLATATLKHLQENSLTLNRSFTLLPIVCISAYAQSNIQEHKEAIDRARKAFRTKEYAPLFDKTIVYFADDVTMNTVNDQQFYDSEKFTKQMYTVLSEF